MRNLTEEHLKQVPPLYSGEFVQARDKIIHLHLFIGGCDWFIVETDGTDICFCFAILNGDLFNAEWGYISLEELKSIKVGGWLEVDFDLYWVPRPAAEVEKIRRAHQWPPQVEELSNRLDMMPA